MAKMTGELQSTGHNLPLLSKKKINGAVDLDKTATWLEMLKVIFEKKQTNSDCLTVRTRPTCSVDKKSCWY